MDSAHRDVSLVTKDSCLAAAVQRRPPFQAFGSSLDEPPWRPVVARELAAYDVKNTFIHFSVEEEESEQPDYRPVRSGPAHLRCFSSPEDDTWEPSVSRVESLCSQGVAESEVTTVDSLQPRELDVTPVSSLVVTPVSSLVSEQASEAHAMGRCRPCAHNWKAGGCSKGSACPFCHLCEEGDFRRRRREKLMRMKAERLSRRGEEAAAANSTEDEKPAAEDLAPGEVATACVNGKVTVQWALDLRKFCLQHRCGEARRFNVRFENLQEEVPFVLFISPSSEEKKGHVSASMQLKCADATALLGLTLDVAFAAGGLPARRAKPAHDFDALPVCKLEAQQALWDLSAAAQGGNRCLLRAELEVSR